MKHRFTPTVYHLTIGGHDLVLRVADGDSIVTSTVDAGGMDGRGEQVTPGGNPQTGPFYIEGAEPGDTLAVRLDHIWPNRDHGFSSPRIVPNALDLGFANDVSNRRVQWKVNHEAKEATLDTESRSMTVPLRPM